MGMTTKEIVVTALLFALFTTTPFWQVRWARRCGGIGGYILTR
jgi:hypothetical protein